jgi:hypothetical protein
MARHIPLVVLLLSPLVPFFNGCTFQNPEWAESINPCCGQDEVLSGGEPSENRCADMVVSRGSAMAIAWRMASSGGMTQWRVRFVPGGPACIWRKWPGLTDDDFAYALRSADSDSAVHDAAPSDTGSAEGGGAAEAETSEGRAR